MSHHVTMSLCCPLQAEEMSDQRENQDKLGTELMQPHGMWHGSVGPCHDLPMP